jgi:hypothetical protein
MSNQKLIKHFNTAHVVGRIQGVPEIKLDKRGKGDEYLRINVNCASRENGNVIAYGQMRNHEKYQSLLGHMKDHPGAPYHLQAFYNQFPEDRTNEGSRRLSSFFFWDWYPDEEEGKDPRSVFILKGLLTGIEDDKVSLQLERESNRDRKGNQVVELFDLFTLSPQFVRLVTPGDTVEVVGEMMSKKGGDRFGRTSAESPIRPYIREPIKLLRSGDGAPFL